MNINTMTINVKKSTVTELNGTVPGNSTTTTTTKVVRDRAVTAPLPSPLPAVLVTVEQQPPKTLPHSQSMVKMESERRRSEARDSEKEVSVTKAEEEEAARGEGSPPVENKSELAVINAPQPVMEEDDDGESDPESPPPVQRHSPLKKTSGISQSNGNGVGVLLHKDSNAADFVDSLVNNKNRINAHNLVGDVTSTVTTMTAAVSLTDTATSTSPPPMKKTQSSSTTTSSSSGPGSNPNYWANQVSLQYENAQNTIEVQKHALRNHLAWFA